MTSTTVFGILAVVVLCWSHPAGAFECPRPEKTSPGVLQETKQDEQVAGKQGKAGAM